MNIKIKENDYVQPTEVRVNAGIAAMRGILVNALSELAKARLAVEQADALVNESRSHSAPTTDEH